MAKKIVIISNISGSLKSFRGELIKSWRDLGYEVYAMAPEFKSDHLEWFKANNINTKEYYLDRSSLNPVNDYKTYQSLKEKLKEINPDYIFAYTIKPVIYSSIISNSLDLKGMYSLIPGLGYSFMNMDLKNKLVNFVVSGLYKYSLDNNDLVFFQNHDDQELFINKGFITENKTAVVNGSGVDIEHYYDTENSLDPVRFLIICRLLKSKGVKDYIEAAKKVKKVYPKVEFDILGGPGKGPDALDMEYVEKADEARIINYHGRQNDVRPYIEDANVYVLPSYYREGTPRSILEAMSMGKAIITTDNPGCRETVIDGVNGYMIPVERSNILADRMISLIDDTDKIIEMGRESRRIAEEKYDVHKVNKDIIEKMGL